MQSPPCSVLRGRPAFAARCHVASAVIWRRRADRFVCPDAGFMCDDPGTLLCRGDLNDCSGKGDCYKGFCYCFIGWGGPDCSVSVCEGECEDVRRPAAAMCANLSDT